MKWLLVLVPAVLLFRVSAMAQEKSVEPGQEVTLKAGEPAILTNGKANPVDLLPKDCKTWNVAQTLEVSDNIFVCKDGKWREYVQKTKAVRDFVPKNKLSIVCAENDTEVTPAPLFEPKTSADKK